MKPSLSVILPVCNAAESLGRIVLRLLDTLPDLTGSFEILIVDDASADHTPEVTDELRRTYPQVRVIRHGWSWGLSAAIRTGRIECRGQHVIVIPSLSEFEPGQLVRQWEQLSRPEAKSPDGQRAAEQPLPIRRTEAAHGEAGVQRQRSFLRHLRQLSDAR